MIPSRMSILRNSASAVAMVALAVALTGCSAEERLKNIGEVPGMTKIQDPTAAPGYQPVALPVPQSELALHNFGSMWQPGARAFFKDHRAGRVGDLLTITVAIKDQAILNNQTQNARKDSTSSVGTNMLGLETLLPSAISASSLVSASGALGTDGQAQINRSEQITTTLAALVTQVLPSGNLVVVGKQEIRVNYEVRDLQITGVVRPTDIDATNTISYDKIAEARISYGGHGQGSDLQQPRYGTQFFDIISPF